MGTKRPFFAVERGNNISWDEYERREIKQSGTNLRGDFVDTGQDWELFLAVRQDNVHTQHHHSPFMENPTFQAWVQPLGPGPVVEGSGRKVVICNEGVNLES